MTDNNLLFPALKYDPYVRYEQPCQIPAYFTKALHRMGGKTPEGKWRFRVEWGPKITWERDGKLIPRYVVAYDTERKESRSEGGIITFTDETRFYGYPHFYIEEWRSVNKFVQSGLAEEAEADWRRNRFQYAMPQTPVATRRLKDATLFKMPDGTTVTGPAGCSWWDICPAGDPDSKIDVVGKFPEGGRYDCLLQIKPAFAEPSEYWLEEIRKIMYEKEHPTFASAEAEAVFLYEQDFEMRKRAREKLDAELVDRMLLSQNRLTNPRPHAGEGLNPARSAKRARKLEIVRGG